MSKLTARQWKYLLIGVVFIDLLLVGGGMYFFTAAGLSGGAQAAAVGRPAGTATFTPTPWAGPGLRPSPTPTWPPTPIPTPLLGPAGFPHGFTPTPRPTRPPVTITLPQLFFTGRNRVDVPVVNQIYYPEPFFPPGTNNACGPVSLFAALQGLGIDVEYSRLRDIAVANGFGATGISKWGMVNTLITLNTELGQPLAVEYGDRYRTRDLIKYLGRGGVVLVLVHVRKENGRYRMVGDTAGSVGHFLLVERINLRTQTVRLAGSTLGMDEAPLIEFLRSWTQNPQLATPAQGWRLYLNQEPAANWAIILKRL